MATWTFRYEPYVIFLIAILATTLGIFITKIFFPTYLFILPIAFVVMVLNPVILKYIEYEERELESDTKPEKLMELLHLNKLYSYFLRHLVFKVYVLIFLGMTITYGVWSAVLDSSYFTGQIQMITSPVSTYTQAAMNVGLVILTSFMLGAGSLFLLGLLASVAGLVLTQILFAIGNMIAKNGIYPIIVPDLGRNFFLGLLPFMGYLFIAFAGGIMAVAVLRYKIVEREFHQSLTDGSIMIIIAIIFLILGILVAT